jgi:putative hydrolase of the HAD superfamily
MINAVLFDLFETLITESHLQPTLASSLAAVLGLENAAYRTAWKARRPRIVVGGLSFAEALTEISHSLSGRLNEAAVQQVCAQRIQEKAEAYSRVTDGIRTMVSELSRRGVRLGVISNGFKEDVLGWPDCVLAPAFHCTSFSCEEGIAKPDPEIYLRAIQRLGVTPDTTLYIGDGGDNELEGAARVGMRAYRATWFARRNYGQGDWPMVRTCDDVLAVVRAAAN